MFAYAMFRRYRSVTTMNKKLLIPLFFLSLIAIASLAYSALLHYQDIQGTFTTNAYYDLEITWANGTENPRFDLGIMRRGDSKDMPTVTVTCLGDGGYVRAVYLGPSQVYVSCREVDFGANVLYTHMYSVNYTFNIWLKEALDEGSYTFQIRFEINDVVT